MEYRSVELRPFDPRRVSDTLAAQACELYFAAIGQDYDVKTLHSPRDQLQRVSRIDPEVRFYADIEQQNTLRILGSLSIRGNDAFLNYLAVAEHLRHKKLGSQALKWLMEQAREAGADTVALKVAHDNKAAQQLYRGNGFAVLDEDSAHMLMARGL